MDSPRWALTAGVDYLLSHRSSLTLVMVSLMRGIGLANGGTFQNPQPIPNDNECTFQPSS